MNKKSKNELLTKYKPVKFDEYVTRAKDSYSKGEIIEAFVILHGILEFMLLGVWGGFVMEITKSRSYAIPQGGWQYNELVKLLYEFKLITDSQKSIFLNFHKGRNEAVHHLGKPFNGKVLMRNLNQRFKNGLKSWDIIEMVMSRDR